MNGAGLRLTAEGCLDDAALLGDPRLVRILDILNDAAEETRLVGGAVRNALLGLPPGDIDLATTAVPTEVMARAKAARLRAIPTGIAHGTVTLMVEGLPFEVTTLREDVETDGRHAVVRFGRDFAADAARRDFTVNALSLGKSGQIFDTTGGIADLAGGRIRFIGDAATRIVEDYLRILRFFRFHANFGIGPLDPIGLAAALAHRDGLTRLSRERIRAEIFKLLVAPRCVPVLRSMAETGFLEPILATPSHIDRLARLDVLEAGTADPVLRLAALAAQTEDDAARLRDKLRLSNAEYDRIVAAVAAVSRVGRMAQPPSPIELRGLLFELGRAAAMDGLLLVEAGSGTTTGDAAWQAARRFLADAAAPRLPFTGADILARGLKGLAVGQTLRHLRDTWATAGFPDDPAVLSGMLKAAVRLAAPPPAFRPPS